MEMILGILIGLVIWQIVIFVLQWFQLEDGWWSCLIPYLGLVIFEKILYFIENIKDIKLFFYFIKIGYNPFKTSITELLTLTDEQKEKMVEIARPKTKKALKRLFKNNKKEISKEVQEALDKLPTI